MHSTPPHPHVSPCPSVSRRPFVVTGKNAYIDQSLFGSPIAHSPTVHTDGCKAQLSPSAGKTAGTPPHTKGPTAAAAKGGTNKLASMLAPSSHDVLTLTKSHLERMLAKSPVLTPAEREARRREAQEAAEAELAAVRRACATAASKAVERRAAVIAAQPPSEMDALRATERAAVVQRAQAAFLEERDGVKLSELGM